MDLLQTLPNITPTNADQQAREIFNKLKPILEKGGNQMWYRPPCNTEIDPEVKLLLESKGFSVINEAKYDLKWVDGEPVRGDMHIRYWIGVLGCKCTSTPVCEINPNTFL